MKITLLISIHSLIKLLFNPLTLLMQLSTFDILYYNNNSLLSMFYHSLTSIAQSLWSWVFFVHLIRHIFYMWCCILYNTKVICSTDIKACHFIRVDCFPVLLSLFVFNLSRKKVEQLITNNIQKNNAVLFVLLLKPHETYHTLSSGFCNPWVVSETYVSFCLPSFWWKKRKLNLYI